MYILLFTLGVCVNLRIMPQYAHSQSPEIDRLTILFDRQPDLGFKKKYDNPVFGEKLPGVRYILKYSFPIVIP